MYNRSCLCADFSRPRDIRDCFSVFCLVYFYSWRGSDLLYASVTVLKQMLYDLFGSLVSHNNKTGNQSISVKLSFN